MVPHPFDFGHSPSCCLLFLSFSCQSHRSLFSSEIQNLFLPKPFSLSRTTNHPQLSIWIPVTSTIQFYKNSWRACFVTELSVDLFVQFLLQSEFAWQKSLIGGGGLLRSGSCQLIFLTPISTPLGSSQLSSGSSANVQQVRRLCLCVWVLATSNLWGQCISPGVPLHYPFKWFLFSV